MEMNRFRSSTAKVLSTSLVFFMFQFSFCLACLAQDPSNYATNLVAPPALTLMDQIKKENEPPEWKIDRLTRESDAILVCKMISQDRVDYDTSIAGDFDGPSIDCILTEFNVLATLKGNAPSKIEVVTIEYSSGIGFAGRKHAFARFYTKIKVPIFTNFVVNGQITGYGVKDPVETSSIEPEYLMFLRKRDDKRYEPITGQRYSALSVRILND